MSVKIHQLDSRFFVSDPLVNGTTLRFLSVYDPIQTPPVTLYQLRDEDEGGLRRIGLFMSSADALLRVTRIVDETEAVLKERRDAYMRPIQQLQDDLKQLDPGNFPNYDPL